MQRATDSDLALFEAFLVEDDPGVRRLMAAVLGIDAEVIDLTSGEATEHATASVAVTLS